MTRPSAAVDSVPRADSLVPLFAALADPTRLRLLNLIAGRELCVCYLVETLRQSRAAYGWSWGDPRQIA